MCFKPRRLFMLKVSLGSGRIKVSIWLLKVESEVQEWNLCPKLLHALIESEKKLFLNLDELQDYYYHKVSDVSERGFHSDNRE